ncbi:hypothetical protein PPL_11017 [Heterostelium album PN500]|uniref:Glycosyltransferase 2-like domain-containing protein n=1 Tax=Heterostelium pallidum (strain ATCC 26659 / Pp 5 / PN500) TaxID=670386 RepID=D3BSP8_HETP5|nr:hypothetical protein PPL_11017 [Heterostelium album PN500]EFA75513.1 hypothetical protein PPL_11017 [Heterostelium album PN500]|eukprot:XP_020427647.1 hypothetical protein PPL_11017 [Heterostelium album PN500]
MEGGDFPLNTPTSPYKKSPSNTTTTTTTTNSTNNIINQQLFINPLNNSTGAPSTPPTLSQSNNNDSNINPRLQRDFQPARLDSGNFPVTGGSLSSRSLNPRGGSSNNIKWKWNNKEKPIDRELAKKKAGGAVRKDSERKLKSSAGILKKRNTQLEFSQPDNSNHTEGLPITEELVDMRDNGGGTPGSPGSVTRDGAGGSASPKLKRSGSVTSTPPQPIRNIMDEDIVPNAFGEEDKKKTFSPKVSKAEIVKVKEKMLTKKKSELQVKRKVTANSMLDDGFNTMELIIGEQQKETVFLLKPYFSHSILQATMLVFIVWNIFYFGFRAGWTINTHDVYTILFSIIFYIVEFVSFLATVLHLNNFSNPCTMILVMTLEEILKKRRKKFPTVMMYVTTYKEPPSIVSRTFKTALSMDYPAENLWVGLLDDSANFRESRGWAHLQGVEKNFLFQLIFRTIYNVHKIGPPTANFNEDPHGILLETQERIDKSTREIIDAEVQWFVEYFILNAWFDIGSEDQGEATEEEKAYIQKLRDTNFSPYRTINKKEREMISKFSIESLRSIWHGNAMYRPFIRMILLKKKYVSNFVKDMNEKCHLRFITPEVLQKADYAVLMMGREEVPWDEISLGNVRIDFDPTGEVFSPRCTYLRRRKPPHPHNKAGNINNGLFNESTKADFEYIGLLDADQQPHPDFLKRVMPYFYSDEGHDCAFVQTPQFFSNIYPVDDPLGHRNMEFYGPVMEGRSANGACPFVGTNAIFRRQPLFDIGGIMYNSVTEDMYTGMKLQVSGYKSWYHNEVLVVGTAPVDIKETLEQRKRWAQGAVEIFSLTPWGYISKKLGYRKMMYNLDSCIYPFLSPTAIFYGLSPLMMCLWTVPIVVTDPVIFILVGMIPVMIVPKIIQYMVLRAKRPYEAGQVGPSLWVEPTDLWRAEQTFFAFAGTYISSWKTGAASIVSLLKQRRISRHKLAMWNWKRDFVKKPIVTEVFRQTKLVNEPVKEEEHGGKKAEQSFRSSNKESDTIKNSRLFLPNLFMFGANVLALVLTVLRFNCFQDDMWLMMVVAGFAFSTCWHIWSFIPMALRQSETQWPYASSFHAHNIFIYFILGFLVLLFVKVKVCIPRMA